VSGRPAPTSPPATVVAIDLGGTAMKGGVATAAGVLEHTGSRPTEREAGPEAVLERVRAYADEDAVEWETGMIGSPLPGAAPPVEWMQFAHESAARLGVGVVDSVDFWTEAALFSGAGFPAVVFGPGSIAQAHTADEWVSVDELDRAARAYARYLAS